MRNTGLTEQGVHARARSLGGALLACAVALTLVRSPARAESPMPTLFNEMGVELNLLGQGLPDRAPGYFDVDLDGVPDAIWAGEKGIVYLAMPEQGEPELQTVTADPQRLELGPRATLSMLPIDVDDDGVQELMVTGRFHTLFELTEARVLKPHKFPLPPIPGVTIFDLAVADFNADGLPDIALALAIIANERLVRRGYPDVILMNVGSGRFESHVFEPAREGFSNGLTVVDMDGDRRPDLIESINYSHNVGASRVLLNRTPPGARVPVFEAQQYPFDTGTHGMGACAADFDQDGIVDIYNTSVGLDQLSIGRPDGSYDDESFPRGVLHLWGDKGLRSQWSPSFEDFNLDGRLDIFVRQGGFGGLFSLDLTGPGVSETGQDVLYLQREDGSLARDFPPYTPVPQSTGRHAVVGDVNSDGRPDISFGGGRGSANFWLNTTPVPEGGRALTVRLSPTVSANPPTGAWVEGACGDLTMKRILTSGGKMGGHASFDMYFAWPECESEVTLKVGWPSGATTTHAVEAASTLAAITEPQWWSASEEVPGSVYVSPGSVGAEEICVQATPDGAWDCCSDAAEGCHLALAEDLEVRAVARVDDALPMALMDRGSTWRVAVEPSPPIPGEEADIRLLHIGDPERFEESEPTLFFGEPLEYAGSSTVDEEHRALRFKVTLPDTLTSMPVSLFCPQGCGNVEQEYPQVTWTLDVGGALDPRWIRADTYPYKVEGGETEFWDWTSYVLARDRITQQGFSNHTKLFGPDGSEVTHQIIKDPMGGSRVRLSVSHEELVGIESLTLLDVLSGYEVIMPVLPSVGLQEASSRIVAIEEGMLWHRLVENGDLGSIYLQLKDADGHTISPALGMVYIEAEGADVIMQPVLRAGAYDLLGMFRTTDCVENGGLVRVFAQDGREISTHPFTCRPEGMPSLDPELSWAQIREAEEPIGGATHTVHIHAYTPHNETLGADAKLELMITGGVQVNAKRLRSDADVDLDIRADPGQHTMTVEVYANDQKVDTLSIDVDIPEPVEADTVESLPDVVDQDLGPLDAGSGTAATESPPAAPSNRDSGCGAGGASGGLLWLSLVLFALGQRRRRWAH